MIVDLSGVREAEGVALLHARGLTEIDDGLAPGQIMLGSLDDDDSVIGVLVGVPRTAYSQPRVWLLAVRSDRERHGIGSALLDAFCSEQFAVGADYVDVQISPTAPAETHRFYQNRGLTFEPPFYRRSAPQA